MQQQVAVSAGWSFVATIPPVRLEELAAGETLEVETENRIYSLQRVSEGQWAIAGHPLHCPSPVPVTVLGSSIGGPMLMPNYIGPGLRLEYWHPEHGLIRTSRVRDIRPCR